MENKPINPKALIFTIITMVLILFTCNKSCNDSNERYEKEEKEKKEADQKMMDKYNAPTKDIIEVRFPKAGCKFYTDQAHTEQDENSPFDNDRKEVKLYVVEKKCGWIKYKFVPEGIKWNNTSVDYYWSKEKETILAPALYQEN